jgi:hypothetical protein
MPASVGDNPDPASGIGSSPTSWPGTGGSCPRCAAMRLWVAAVMARSNVPLVAVVDKNRTMTGAITLDGLLDHILGT